MSLTKRNDFTSYVDIQEEQAAERRANEDNLSCPHAAFRVEVARTAKIGPCPFCDFTSEELQ